MVQKMRNEMVSKALKEQNIDAYILMIKKSNGEAIKMIDGTDHDLFIMTANILKEVVDAEPEDQKEKAINVAIGLIDAICHDRLLEEIK